MCQQLSRFVGDLHYTMRNRVPVLGHPTADLMARESGNVENRWRISHIRTYDRVRPVMELV